MTKQRFDIETEAAIKSYLSSTLQVRVTGRIDQGHLGLPIYRCERPNSEKLVIKVGLGLEGKREIEDNVVGYTQISNLGATMLVPDPLSKIDTPWGPSLIMPDLGIDFRQASVTPESTRKNFRILQNSLTRVFRSSLRNGQELHAKGIEETIRQAAKWLSELEKVKLISLGSLEKLHRLDSTALSGSRAAIMLLDFTPDNVFIIGNSAKFIDPWKQREYIGAPIPGISQFITLSEDVYHIPGFNDNDLQYSSFIDEIGLSLLGLTPTQLSGQVNLGRVLQYSLSSFVRIKSNPDLSRFYADLAEKALSNIT